MSRLAIELYNCLDQEINDSDREAQRRRMVVTGLGSSQHFLPVERKKTNLRKSGGPFNGTFWLLFWLEWSERERQRQRGLINNLYDDMESHNSKAVSEIYLSTGYFQSLLPIGNGTWQKDAWTKRRKNYWLVEYKSIQEYLSLVTSSSALNIYICNDFRSDDDAYSFDIYCMIEYHFLVPLENDGIYNLNNKKTGQSK